MQRFHVPDMTCSHCEKRVRDAVLAVDPTAQVVVDLSAHEVQIETAAREADLVVALADAGYPAERRAEAGR